MDNNSFWGNNPAILLNKNEILELFPTSSMNYNQKLNSITRLIILLTLVHHVNQYLNGSEKEYWKNCGPKKLIHGNVD